MTPLPIMRAVILIRLLVGLVFLSEGIQKFLFPAALGVGRFEKIEDRVSTFLRAICGLGGNCVRRPACTWPIDEARLCPASDRHMHGDRDHQNSDSDETGILAHSA